MGVDILVWVMAVVLIGIGLGGLVLPALPGPPILFAGLVTAAWAEDFAYVGWGTLSVLGGMAVLFVVTLKKRRPGLCADYWHFMGGLWVFLFFMLSSF